MTAMRLMSKGDFYMSLENHGFTKQQELNTENYSIWLHTKSNECVTIPTNLDAYPDYLLDRCLEAVGGLYVVPQNVIAKKKYKAKEPA